MRDQELLTYSVSLLLPHGAPPPCHLPLAFVFVSLLLFAFRPPAEGGPGSLPKSKSKSTLYVGMGQPPQPFLSPYCG